MGEADPVAVFGTDAQNVAHDIYLKDIKVLVDRGEEKCFELVRAGFDLMSVRFFGDGHGAILVVVFAVRWAEPEGCGRCVKKALLDAVDGALGEDVDAVDDVVEEALRTSIRVQSIVLHTKLSLLTTGG